MPPWKAALGGEHQTEALASGGELGGQGSSLGNCTSVSQEGAVPVGPGLVATSAPPHPVPSQLEPGRVPSATEALGGAGGDGDRGESPL